MRAMRICLPLLALVLLGCQGKRAVSPDEENAPPGPAPEETPKWDGASSPPPTTSKPSPGGGVHEATARRKDQYDKEATEVVLKRAARLVKDNCGAAKDDSGKAVGPWGKTSVQIQLGNNGHSKGVTVPAPFQGKPSGNCVEKAFANLTYPPWGGDDTQVEWEVELVQPSSGDKK